MEHVHVQSQLNYLLAKRVKTANQTRMNCNLIAPNGEKARINERKADVVLPGSASIE